MLLFIINIIIFDNMWVPLLITSMPLTEATDLTDLNIPVVMANGYLKSRPPSSRALSRVVFNMLIFTMVL